MTRRLESPEDARARLERAALDERERAALWARIEASTAASRAASRQRTGRRRAAVERWAWIATSALASAGAAWLLFASHGRPPERERASRADAGRCVLDLGARELQLPARCAQQSARIAGDDWQLSAGAQVARTADGAAVRTGRVRFSVRKRAPGTQFRVRVSHGEVRVVGTVFVVEQRQDGGSVSVSEGVIEFVWADGSRERVAAGQTLQWPRAQPAVEPEPAAAEPEPAPAAVAPEPAPADAGSARAHAELDRTLERLLQLQSQKRHPEAIALLQKTLAQPQLSKLQRERISFELGVALEAAGRPSCPHWQRHLTRFGPNHRPTLLAERIARCRQHGDGPR